MTKIIHICLFVVFISGNINLYGSNDFLLESQNPKIFLLDSILVGFPEEIKRLPNDSLLSYLYHSGYSHYQKSNFDSARIYFELILNIKEELLQTGKKEIAISANNLGVMLERLWLFEKALEKYNKAEQLLLDLDSTDILIGDIYRNKAIVYTKRRDIEKSNEYLENAIEIYQSQTNVDEARLSYLYSFGAINSARLRNYKNQRDYLNKSFNLKPNKTIQDTINYLNEIAISFYNDKQNEKAKSIFSYLFELLEKNQKEDYYHAKTSMNYALFMVDNLQEYNTAINLYKKALKIYLKERGETHISTALCYGNIGEYYEKVNNLSEALRHYQLALSSLVANSQNMEILNYPRSYEKNTAHYLYYMKRKAYALFKLYNSNQSEEILNSSFQHFSHLTNVLDSIRINYETEESKFRLSKDENLTYKQAINVSYKLFQVTNDIEYLNDCYNFLEKSKSYSLLSSIRDLEAKEFGNIPPHLLKEESELYKKIAAHKEWIFEEEKRRYPDRAKIETWEANLFRLNQQYERLLNQFELEYPSYYNLKYDTRVITPEELQERLRPNETLLEYSVQDSMIYIFAIARDKFDVKRIPVDSSFYRDIDFLVHHVGRKDFSYDVGEIYREYKKSAHHLYRILLEPVADMIEGQTLVIIPDGQLSYIPFGALLTNDMPTDRIDYRHLPYVVLDHIIGYSYSATLQYDIQRKIDEPEKLLLAFAPSYENISIRGRQSDPEYMQDYRSQLVPITGILDEVKGITRILKGDYYLEEEATETRFKQMARDYKILHLAMHTLVNDEDPMYSKLAFALDVDESNDGFLNTYEIYNMRYNASLAVLSSCESGYGKLQTGEGVMSLARAFMYAGCPSIVMTLWEVSDKTGADLMEDFYRYLKKGYSKPEALQKAKISFIQRSDNLKANPYFWSAYVSIGDPRPIFTREVNPWFYIIVLAVLFGGSLSLLFKRRRKKVTRY